MENGVTSGTSASTFSPNAGCTRARSSRSSIVPIRASKGNTDKSERTSGSPAGSSGICKEKELLAKVEDETIRYVEQFVKDTLKAMDMDVEITSSIDKDGALYVDMKGENMGILIGKRGQTLDSLQYLANRVANKHQSGYVRVKLDTENYRARREETLKHLAKKYCT